jgi:hypothetical protein
MQATDWRPTHHGHFRTFWAALSAANRMVGFLNDRIRSVGSFDDAYLRQLDANLFGLVPCRRN